MPSSPIIGLPDPFVGTELAVVEGSRVPDRLGVLHARDAGRQSVSPRVVVSNRSRSAGGADRPTWWLQFDGINYRANVWLNGVRVASATEVAGAYRRYAFDVSRVVRAGARNALAVEIFPPSRTTSRSIRSIGTRRRQTRTWACGDLSSLTTTGPVAMRHPYVLTDRSIRRPTQRPADGDGRGGERVGSRRLMRSLSATIDNVHVSRTVSLAPREQQTIRMTPAEHAELILRSPRLWWPYRMGAAGSVHRRTWRSRSTASVSDRRAVDIRRSRRDIGADARKGTGCSRSMAVRF